MRRLIFPCSCVAATINLEHVMYIDLTPCRNALYPLLPGLSRNGKLVVLGGTMDNIPVAPLQLIGQRKTIQGWPSGTGRDSQVRASNRPPLRKAEGLGGLLVHPLGEFSSSVARSWGADLRCAELSHHFRLRARGMG